MKIDFSTHDGVIVLGASPRQSVWANSCLLRGGYSTRCAGKLPLSTAQTLLTVALVGALQTITRKQVDSLLRGKAQSKLRLVIGCEDAGFVDSLGTLIRRQKPAKPLRAGKNFFRELARQVQRFDCELIHINSEEDYCVKILREWSSARLPDPQSLRVPPVFVPSLVGTMQ